jgi:hypothetical protein
VLVLVLLEVVKFVWTLAFGLDCFTLWCCWIGAGGRERALVPTS